MYFFKNELINKVIDMSLGSWSHTLNAGEFVEPCYLKSIDKKIFENMKKQFKDLEIYNLLWLQEKGFALGLFAKLRIWFSGLKPLWLSYKNEIAEAFDKAEAELENEKTPTESPPQKVEIETADAKTNDPHAWDIDAEITKEKEFLTGKTKGEK